MSERTFYERVVEHRGHKYITLKSGRLVGFWQMLDAAERARTDLGRSCSRAFKLAVANADPDMAEYDLERLDYFVDSMEGALNAAGHRGAARRQDAGGTHRPTAQHNGSDAR